MLFFSDEACKRYIKVMVVTKQKTTNEKNKTSQYEI